MKRLRTLFKESAEELKYIQTLTTTALLIAIAVVLSFYTLSVTETMKVGFSYLAKELTGFLFGPVVAGLMGGVTDIIQYVVKPTGAFFPGFTLDAIVAGLIYGIFLYKKPLKVWRVLAANATVSILVNLLLATYWLSILYGTAFVALLPARALKQIIMLPIETILFFLIAQILSKSNVRQLIAHK